MMAITSGIILITMAIAWLVVSTNTALMNRKLRQYDVLQEQNVQDTMALWAQIGDVTSAQKMDKRAREAGFIQPQSVEFMIPQSVTTVVSSTLQGGGVR